MRIPTLAVLTTLAALTATPAPAQTYSGNYPVCLHHYRWGGSYIECSFTSLAQCAMTASGLSAACVLNPYYANAQVPRKPNHRQPRSAY